MAEFVEGQWGDPRPGLLYGEHRLSRHDVAAASAARAALLADLLPHGAEPHVGVLLGNVPEFPLWLGAAACAGATVVGINPTRRGAELARDITHTECVLLVTERAHLPALRGLALPLPPERLLVVDDPAYPALLRPYEGAAPPRGGRIRPGTRLMLCFTSGSTGTPKAVVVSQGRLADAGASLSGFLDLGPDDVHYLCMPLFHGNAVLAGWAPALAGRADDRLRVDGENLAAAVVENVLARFDAAAAVAVYAVPDPVSGDQVMAALALREGAAFDPGAFAAFLAAQPDLGTKSAPRFVRVVPRMPVTATNKVRRAALRREGFRCPDPVWWSPPGDGPCGTAYRRLDAADLAALLEGYRAQDRAGLLDR